MGQNDDLLIDDMTADDLAAAFGGEDFGQAEPNMTKELKSEESRNDDIDEDLPGQLAVDVYETEDKLVVKARTAGVNKKDLNVSISEGILTISGTLSGGDEEDVVKYHFQECYWGEFARSVSLPVAVNEEEVAAVLKEGVLTISFNKIVKNSGIKIEIQ